MNLLTPEIGTLAWLLIGTPCLLLLIISLISLTRNQFRDGNSKIMWLLAILLIPFVGSLLYLAIGTSQRIEKG